MAVARYDTGANLADLRDQLTERLALVLIIASGALIWLGLLLWVVTLSRPFPFIELSLLAGLLGLGFGVQLWRKKNTTLARYLLPGGLVTTLLVAMGLFSETWLPFLGLMLIFLSGMLVTGGELMTAGLIGAFAVWLEQRGIRAYPLSSVLVALAVSVLVTRLVLRTMYTALEWAWTMQQQADDLLELARDRQVELSRTMKSLDLANIILRRTQRELVTASQQADEARLMKEQFVANVSHELRTPLNLIVGFSEVMCLSPEVYGVGEWPLTLRQDIYQIYRSARHLREMINDILDLSRFEMAGFTLNKEPTALEPLVGDAVEMVQGFLRGRAVKLEIDIMPGLPSLDIDRVRIRQVLLNLLNNAIRFTEKGKVCVVAKKVNREVIVSVSDTGPGISSEELPHVFEEFYVIDHSLHREQSGVGLGLTISKHFVEAHDGRIWVESPATVETGDGGSGSTFTFTLPVPGESVPLLRAKRNPRPQKPLWPEPQPAVLVVDPDPAVAALLDRHLEAYQVVQIEEVDQIAHEIMLHHPRAVVHNLPPGKHQGSNDDKIPDIDFSVPFIECSLPSWSWLVDDLSVVAYLNKPLSAETLLGEIDRLGQVKEVLVIDDDRAFCRLVERILAASERDVAVRRAYDGEEGLRAMQTQPPDLVLLDFLMPEMDGLQMLAEMRQQPSLAGIPVILLTATNFVEDALVQRGSRMVVHRAEGLNPFEVLRCLGAVLNELEPRYDEKSIPKEAFATRPTKRG